MSRVPPMTPIPDCLIDDLMPFLKDTEFRVLCIIGRHTLGWRNPRTGERKGQDWISHHQFRHQTGRSSAAISRAIDWLCRDELIRVTDGAGRALPTARARRQLRSRLYFCLNPLLLEDRVPDAFIKRRLPNLKTTTRHSDNSVVVAQMDKGTPILERQDEGSRSVQDKWQKVGELLRDEKLSGRWRKKR